MFNLIKTEGKVFDPKFAAYAELMNRLQNDYDVHKHTAMKIRMEMIGKSEEQRRLYKMQSEERRYIDEGYRKNGWTSDIVENNWSAWCKFKELKDSGVPEYQALADKCNPSQLMILNRGEGTGLVYDAAQALKRTGKVPSTTKLRGRLGGYTDSKFESQNVGKPSRSQTPPSPAPKPPVVSPEDEQRRIERSRLSVSEAGYQHLEDLVANEELPLINNVETAQIWNSGDKIESCLNVIEQELRVRGSSGCPIEMRLREILYRHAERIHEELVEQERQSKQDHYLKLLMD